MPLLWGQLQQLQAIVNSAAPYSGPQDIPELQLAEAHAGRCRGSAGSEVENIATAMHYIAAVGTASLWWQLFVMNTLMVDVDGGNYEGGAI